jgi:hypothetical protein
MDHQNDLLRRAAEEWERLRRISVFEIADAAVRPARYVDWAYRSTPWSAPARRVSGSRDTSPQRSGQE